MDVSPRSRVGVFLRLPTATLLPPIVDKFFRGISGFKKLINFSSLLCETLTYSGLDSLTIFGLKIFVESVFSPKSVMGLIVK